MGTEEEQKYRIQADIHRTKTHKWGQDLYCGVMYRTKLFPRSDFRPGL